MFGKRLRELRENNGFSMDKLVELYNEKFNGKMNKSTLSRYENSIQEPMYTVVVNLANLFMVSVDYLSGAIDEEIEEKTKYDDISNTSLSDYELNIIATLNKLNKEGQQKAEAYIKDLLGNASYNNELQKKEYTLADYGQIAAEGGEGSRGPNIEEFDIL